MYNSFSQIYDQFVNWQNRLQFEIPFLIDKISTTIKKPPSETRILDAATGTGMHAIALAQKGYIAGGVDISEGMIHKARENAWQKQLPIRFDIAGFGEIYNVLFTGSNQATRSIVSKPPSFDAILCLGNSLPHVDSEAELLAALKDFSACLSNGGLLILQNRNFDAVQMTKERWMEPQFFSDGENESIFLRFYDFLPDGHIQFNIVTLQRVNNGDWEQSILETRLFPITQSILVQALEAAGFYQITKYGALSNVPFNRDSSGNLVITAIKK
jgi:glycine/sarcosine N-methyltransferase